MGHVQLYLSLYTPREREHHSHHRHFSGHFPTDYARKTMEGTLEYKNLLIAGGASTVSHSVVWLPGAVDKEEIVAFLCNNHIQVYERHSKRVELSLRSQEERLDCISGIYLRDRNVYVLLSGSAKGVINVWVSQSRHSQGYLQWRLHQSFTFPSNAAVSSLAVSYVSSIDTVLIAASDAKGQVQIYRSSRADPHDRGLDMEFSLYQKLAFPTSQLPKSLKFAPLVHDTLALVVGGVDSKVHLFVHNISTLSTSTLPGFRGVGNLWGHEEWVTCLDAINVLLPAAAHDGPEQERQEATFIASGSQDNKIRIWKVVGKAITPVMAAALGFGSDDANDAATRSTDNNAAAAAAAAAAATTTTAVVYEDDEDDDDEDDDMGGGDGDGSSGNKNASSSSAKAVIDTEDIQDAEARLTFTNQDRTILYQVFLESLLLGHEDWVTSVAWMPIRPTAAAAVDAPSTLDLDNLALFSTSMDRNMVVWCPNASNGGVWTPLVRVGDVGGALGGSIGGNLLGFVSGCAAPDGQCVIGIGYGGSFHCWARTVDPHQSTTTTSTAAMSGYQTLAESRWIPKPFVSGHFDHVTSLSWASAPTVQDEQGDRDDYLLTASADQTCRLYAPIVAQDPHFESSTASSPSSSSSSSASSASSMWREIARPLIHGYNLNAVVPRRFGSAQILVASDEKLIRHFIMSRMVQESLSHLAGIDVSLHPSEAPLSVDQAYIPELGLSNKPKESMNSQEQKEQEARNVSMIDWQAMQHPPAHAVTTTTTTTASNSGNDITWERGLLESQLADYTVWLEVNKWYGHAYDVLCLSQVSRCGRFIASACRAKFAQTQHTPLPKASNYDLGQAGGLGILVWELPLSCCRNVDPTATTTTTTTTTGGEIIARLEEGHEMSVVSLEFSPNGRYLASCGKDRSICLHVQEADPRRPGRMTFTSVVAVKNAHKRIIWDASWTADSRFLLTGSRDGALKIWTVVLDAATQTVPVDLRCVYAFNPFARYTANPSVTALDVYPYPSPLLTSTDDILVVVGSGGGEMQVVRLRVTEAAVGTASTTEAKVTVDVLCEVPHEQAHSATVRKVMWRRPTAGDDASSPLVWASGSEDHTVRIHQLALV